MKLSCLFGHKWNGCLCERCGAVRDEGHNFISVEGSCQSICSRCGEKGSLRHKWNHVGRGCKCEVCGATRTVLDLNGHRFPYVFDPHVTVGMKEHRSCTCADCGWVDTVKDFGHVYEYTYEPLSAKHKGVCTICGKIEFSEHFYTNGVCEYCGYKPGVDLNKTVADFASYVSLSLDESELDEMEKKLLAEGEAAEAVIFGFLARCSYGGVGIIQWWKQAKRLTKMLPKFKTAKVKEHLAQLADNASRTRSWEYCTEIADTAKEELAKL